MGDLLKAIDTIGHDILLQNLHATGFNLILQIGYF